MKRLYVQVLTVSVLVAAVYGCKCLQRTFEEHYCQADYVARVRVLSPGYNDQPNTIYNIATEHIYKSEVKPRFVDKTHLYTATSSAACGVTLDSNTTYIITGSYIRTNLIRTMHTSLCDFQMQAGFDLTVPLKCRKVSNGV